MALASLSASVRAASSDSKRQKRVPPRAGPRAVEWMAMMARSPEGRSWLKTTCSQSSPATRSKTPMRALYGAPLQQLRLRSGKMDAMVPASQLRVYEPLDSFPEEERRRWARYIEADAPLPRAWSYCETTFHGPGHVGLIYPVSGDHAYVRRVHGQWLVCPWSVQVGGLTGVLSFGSAVSAGVAHVLVPDTEAARAASEIERLRRENPAARDNVAIAAWHVPFRWLAAFDDTERILTAERPSARLGPASLAGERGAVRIRYETDLALGVTRLRRAHDILDEAGLDKTIVTPVGELADWMSGFDADSILELDYWGLSSLVSVEDLEADRSAGEIWACLEAMELGDVDESH